MTDDFSTPLACPNRGISGITFFIAESIEHMARTWGTHETHTPYTYTGRRVARCAVVRGLEEGGTIQGEHKKPLVGRRPSRGRRTIHSQNNTVNVAPMKRRWRANP